MNVKTRRTKSGLNLNLMSHISFPPFRSQKRDCCRYAATTITAPLLYFLFSSPGPVFQTIATATTALQKEKTEK